MQKLSIMLTTEGTYPFHQGGVSSWCDTIIRDLDKCDFTVYSVVMNPYVTQKFTLPSNAKLYRVPLWGTEDPGEHLPVPFSDVYKAKKRTGQDIIEGDFVPLFSGLIEQILSRDSDVKQLGHVLAKMYNYFQTYDYKVSFKYEGIWEIFKEHVMRHVADKESRLPQPNIFDLLQSLGWIYRFLVITNTPIPPVDVNHSTAAGFSGLPCVIAKIQNKTPYILTEHGVYLREQYLSLSRRRYSSYLSTFLTRLISAVVRLNYFYADMVAPVCRYNTRWEREFGVSAKDIRVIYNGVQPKLFYPSESAPQKEQLTVVAVARIDPVKDLITLLKAAFLVKEKIPGVRFVVYGSIAVPEYHEECLEVRRQLGLEEDFIFAGHTDDPPAAYRGGDVIALSSITEAFPYSVVEAMMTGKPVVATDVGGVREALDNCGLIVRPRKADELAEALIMLLNDKSLRAELGREAREKALNFFTIDRMVDSYYDSYNRLNVLALGSRHQSVGLFQLYLDKAYALMISAEYEMALGYFRKAIQTAPDSPAAPAIILEMARIYCLNGKFDLAFMEMHRAEVLAEFISETSVRRNRAG